jgi:solute carrier family 25 (adenine nucleotide translocator) protein 4/5/6/31
VCGMIVDDAGPMNSSSIDDKNWRSSSNNESSSSSNNSNSSSSSSSSKSSSNDGFDCNLHGSSNSSISCSSSEIKERQESGGKVGGGGAEEILINASAGMAAGIMSKTTMAPVERIKLIMQLEGGTSSRGAVSHMREVLKTQGFLSLWRGNTSNILRVAGSSAMNLTLKDYYASIFKPYFELGEEDNKKRKNPENSRRRRKLFYSMLSGAVAGASSTTVFYPLEFARTRLAMDQGVGTQRKYPRGTIDVVKSVLKTDGILGMYKGFGVAMGKFLNRTHNSLSAVFMFVSRAFHFCIHSFCHLTSNIAHSCLLHLSYYNLHLSIGGVVIFRALHLGGYDYAKSEAWGDTNPTFQQRFATAQVVSTVSGTICYPIDTIRRRLMMQAGEKEVLYNNS